jgi:hypothetical protein
MKALSAATSNQITDSITGRLFYDKVAGLLYWKLTSATTVSYNVGTTSPNIAICQSADAFTLAQAGSFFLDLDVANLPYKIPQSLFVKNTNWVDWT